MREEIRHLARTTFAGYCSAMRANYKIYQHLAPINAAVEDIAAGRITRAVFSMPPRHGKSYSVSEMAPAYMMGQNKGMKYMQGAYGADLARDFGRAVRNQMQSELYRDIFGFGLSQNVTAADNFHTVGDGTYFAGGINSGFVGKGANWFNIDDPFKTRKEAESITYRKQVIDWLQAVVYDRLEDFDDGRDAILTICATRWHPEDLSGWVMKNLADEGFVYIALPAVVDQNGSRCNPTDPGAIPLFPEKWTLEKYQQRKTIVGSYEWDAKYQQNPTPPKGGIINVEWFQRYRQLPRVTNVVQSWDTAQKNEVTSAYSVCGTWHTAAGRYYLDRMFREKLQYPDLKRMVISLAERDSPGAVLIEDKASGIQLIQDLKRDTSIPVIAIEPEADKVVRAFGQSALVEAGLVYLPESAPWLPDFESEIRAFPGGDYADQIDQLTQFLAWQRNRGDSFSFASTGRRVSADIPSGNGGFASTR